MPKKVLTTQFLRSEPRFLPLSFIDAGDGSGNLQVIQGEAVNFGSKPDVQETVGERQFKWIFVEATSGQLVDKRKGYVENEFLGSDETQVPVSPGFEPFDTEVHREDFASTCYLQAVLNEANPAYLYALAFALSGSQWTDKDVRANDPPDAQVIGVYRFSKETWQHLIAEPEATNIVPEDIKFPEVQCIVAAIQAAKSATLLKSKITTRDLSALDLCLAHLFADSQSFGTEAAFAILQAEAANKTQACQTVVKTIYASDGDRAAFYKRNADIFKADGSATIEEAIKVCTARLDAGFGEVRKLSEEADTDVFGDSVPSNANDALPGTPNSDNTGSGAEPTRPIDGIVNGIDRRQFLDELGNPAIVRKLANMVKGEVGWSAPHNTKLVQLETAFNRAMARGHSLAQALLSTSEDRRRGYYQGGANGTYSRPVTKAEFDDFKKNLLPLLVAGSSKSEELLGFVATGNASPPVSTAQYRRGTQGGDLPTAVPNHPESYFHQGPFRFPFKRLKGPTVIQLPTISTPRTGPAGEPPEQMDGDTEGSGPPGGKFNVRSGTPALQVDHKTIRLSNSQKVTVNKAVADQFLGFFNDLIKNGAPVRGLGGFGERNNPSQHPIGYAVDWAQTKRNVVAADVADWIRSNRALLRKLERRWGMSGGENWHNPDTGHFSIERILGEEHLKASRGVSEGS